MCGIAGLYLKNKELAPRLGSFFAPMLSCMGGRGWDSTGFAIYGEEVPEGWSKLTLYCDEPDYDWSSQVKAMGKSLEVSTPGLLVNNAYAVVKIQVAAKTSRAWIEAHCPTVRVMSVGRSIEILKEIGTPDDIIDRFNVPAMKGTHVIGHTRMATESSVSLDGCHPFSTGLDLCLVHNGSLSNHNQLRRKLWRQGVEVRSENDSEIAAAFLAWRMMEGDSLDEALKRGLQEIDGFYTFCIGTREGFAVLRDPIACKPAVMLETEDYVAIGSEFQALASLPGADDGHIWEPRPAQVYSWTDIASSVEAS